jgi:hypothetical protein
VLKILPGDPAAEMFLQRAKELATAPRVRIGRVPRS